MGDNSFSSQHVQYKNTGIEEYDDSSYDISNDYFLEWAVFVDGIWMGNENREIDPFEELQFF